MRIFWGFVVRMFALAKMIMWLFHGSDYVDFQGSHTIIAQRRSDNDVILTFVPHDYNYV